MSGKIKVLMVDDEERFRETTEKILRKKGFDTILAATGEQALDKLAQSPDVVVLDVKMPGMDGHQVLRGNKRKESGYAGHHAHRPRQETFGTNRTGAGGI
jgi:CheY-like chemotaxis protein